MPSIASLADTLFEADRRVEFNAISDPSSIECCSCLCWDFGTSTSESTHESDDADRGLTSQKTQAEAATITLSSRKEKIEPQKQTLFFYIGVFCLLLMLALYLGLFGVDK